MGLLGKVQQGIRRTVADFGSVFVDKLHKYFGRASIVAALLLLPNYELYDLEANLYDAQIKAKNLMEDWSTPNKSPDIAIIGIDDQARRADATGRLNKIPPMSRGYIAEVLSVVKDLKPKVIVLDFFLDTPASPASDDKVLAESIRAAYRKGIPVILACRVVNVGKLRFPLLPIAQYLQGGPVVVGHAHGLASPIDGVMRTAEVAMSVIDESRLAWLDQAGITDQLRYFDLHQEIGAPGTFFFWSLAGATLMSLRDEVLSKRLRAMLNTGPFRIDFSIPNERVYATYSSGHVLARRAHPSLIEGRIVLIGANYVGSPDRYPTSLSVNSLPVGRVWAVGPVLDQHLSGTEIQAYIINTLANKVRGRGGIREASLPLVLLGFAVALVVILLCSLLLPSWWAGLIVTPPVIYAVAAIVLFQVSGLYMPILRPLAAYFLLSGLGHGFLFKYHPAAQKQKEG